METTPITRGSVLSRYFDEIRDYPVLTREEETKLAHDVKRDAIRTFVLTRLRRPELTDTRFNVPKNFNAAEYLRGSFSAFKGHEDYEVVIDFDAWAADLIRGRKWHATQELTELPSGELRLRMRLDSLEEAEP